MESENAYINHNDIDQLRQEYIDTQKMLLPNRADFRLNGSTHFSSAELGTNGYDPFLFNQDFLVALEEVRTEYGQPMIVLQTYGERRAYSSPGNHFTSTPAVGLPTYWEDDPESEHIYGYAIDIFTGNEQVWNTLSTLMEEYDISTSNPAGDYSYIHAEYDHPLTSLISITIDPPSVRPGRDDTYTSPSPPSPNPLVREFEICGTIDTTLAPFTDGELILKVEEVLYSGGHFHPNRPMNHDPEPNRISGEDLEQNNGEFLVEYEDPCQWGGQYQVRAYFTKESKTYCGRETFDIRWENLSSLPDNPAYDLKGTRDQHPDNHYGRSEFFDIIVFMANRFTSLVIQHYPDDTPPRVYINDLCLVCGGRFDIGPPKYKFWDYDHKSHRIGCSMDHQYHNMRNNQKYYILFLQANLEAWLALPDPKPKRPHEYPSHSHIHFWFCQYAWE